MSPSNRPPYLVHHQLRYPSEPSAASERVLEVGRTLRAEEGPAVDKLTILQRQPIDRTS
jgi:hypothetical protein